MTLYVSRATLGGADLDSFETDLDSSEFEQLLAPVRDQCGTKEPEDLVPDRESRSTWLRLVLVMGSYVAIAALSVYPALIHGPTRILQAYGDGDLSQQVWFIEFAPWAILHGHSPFITTWINAPNGANLLGNTSFILPSLLATPVTLLFGPIAGFNFLIVLSFAISAGSMYFVVTHWVDWRPAAYVAGLLYGFSPFMVGQGLGHIFLLFEPVAPLVLYLAYEILLGHRFENPRRPGFLLGLLFAAQFFISTEILATFAVMGFLGGVAALFFYGRPLLDRTRFVLSSLFWGTTTFLVICIAPLLLLFDGPDHYVGPAQTVVSLDGLRADLASIVRPTFLQLFHPLGTLGPFNDTPEAGVYLGVPLVAFSLIALWKLRSRPAVRATAVMLLAVWVLSLGPSLTVWGHATRVPLPFTVLAHLPVFQNIVPSRLSLFLFLFLAPLMAFGLQALRDALRRWKLKGWNTTSIVALTVAVLFFPLLPNWPYGSGSLYVPSFITSPAEELIPAGSTVATYPFPDIPTTTPMSWQSIDEMRYKLLGGEMITPRANGTATFYGSVSDISGLSYFAYLGHKMPNMSAGIERGIRLDLEVFGVGTVVVAPMGEDPGAMRTAYGRALAEPGHDYDGTYVWFDVQQRLAFLRSHPT